MNVMQHYMGVSKPYGAQHTPHSRESDSNENVSAHAEDMQPCMPRAKHACKPSAMPARGASGVAAACWVADSGASPLPPLSWQRALGQRGEEIGLVAKDVVGQHRAQRVRHDGHLPLQICRPAQVPSAFQGALSVFSWFAYGLTSALRPHSR